MGLRTILGLKKKKAPAYLNECYSQEGEDGILNRIFEDQKDGFFIDVGAHHPIRFSNTYKFYKHGWRGINIDAMPGSMNEFNKIRSEDINLEIPVSDKREIMPFYIFNEPAINTFSKEMVDEIKEKNVYTLDNVVNIEARSLGEILDEYLPENQKISFLTIDAEGFDFRILTSNNWQKYRPSIVLVESELSLMEFINSETCKFMQAQDYEFFAKTVRSCFFKHNSLSV